MRFQVMIDFGSSSLLQPDHHEGSAFAVEIDVANAETLNLLVLPPGSRAAPAVLWSRQFDSIEDRDSVLGAIHGGRVDLTFLGRLAMIFGPADLEGTADSIVADAQDHRRAAAEQTAEIARKHQIVELYAPDTKRGYVLELKRKSRDKADWRVVYDRASERDRLCDWLRWQQPNFLDYLTYAAQNGDEALTVFLIDAMFETERRVKKEGRGAGGTRPLRMWRGS